MIAVFVAQILVLGVHKPLKILNEFHNQVLIRIDLKDVDDKLKFNRKDEIGQSIVYLVKTV